MTKELFYALAARTKEAGELFDKCYEKAELSAKAHATSQSEYVNGFRQHEYSKRSFASMAKGFEDELIPLLRELRELSLKSRRLLSDFKFLAGGRDGSLSAALGWCSEHGVDEGMIKSMLQDTPYAQLDFGLTKESFLKLSNRLSVLWQSSEAVKAWISWILAPGSLPQAWPPLTEGSL